MNKIRRISAVKVLLLVACLLPGLLVKAAPPAGTIIKNQASATYTDSNGIERVATSNVVETTIQQVAAMQLDRDQNKLAAAGQQVFLSHTVTNGGNGLDNFSVSVSNDSAGDDFDLIGLQIYNDANQDGRPDTYSPVNSSPALDSQMSWHFVIAGTIPASISEFQISRLTLTVNSQFNTGVVVTNTNSVSVADGAVVEVTKSLSNTSGTSPSDPVTVTLGYRNTGSGVATDVTLIDALPAGMLYIAGSARWNETGATVLSDSNPADPQGSVNTVRYCAYNASCIGLAEAESDADNDSSNQITAILSSVAPGEAGQITFQVQIGSGLNAGNLGNTAEFEYLSGPVLTNRYSSNSVTFQVLHSTAVVLNGSATVAVDNTAEPVIVSSSPQGTAISFVSYVWNTGNGTDTYDLVIDSASSTFPAGSLFRLLQSDGVTPLIDSSGNGLPDTGPLAAGTFCKVVVQIIPPSDAQGDNGGAGYSVTTTATSISDSSVSNSILDRLLSLTSASVDITNVANVNDIEATGAGSGPEAVAVSTFSVSPGSTLTLPLFINNTGATATSFDLAGSIFEDYSEVELPEGWQISFRKSGEEEELSNTGVILPGEFMQIDTLITVPANTAPGTTSLYFRAWSQATGALDIKHDAIEVASIEQLLLELNQAGQLDPGGSYVYDHLLTNTGNTVINSVTLSLSDSEEAQGWTSALFEDTDADGKLGPADLVITDLATIAIGEVRQLFLKVFAPAGAELQSTNTTELQVSWNSGSSLEMVSNVTTVTSSEINIVKEQAPDLGCNGTLNSPYSVSDFSIEPGNNCVSYRLTATNAGLVTVYNVEVTDATPAFTAYFGTAFCSIGSCTVTEPVAGGQGNINASLGSLEPGGSVILIFSVRVE
ncbi:hypothetical protein AB833_07245 [Chromatiales bacterium (ex Bugula neritina AB1)]|nr:hypothetical protein AB833_07245 [Chromatiales bacterium (ex Bugula neritina AB1)]